MPELACGRARDGEAEAGRGLRMAEPEACERLLEILRRSLVLTPPEEGLADLAVELRTLQWTPIRAGGAPISLESAAVVREGLTARGDAARVVAGTNQKLLRAL